MSYIFIDKIPASERAGFIIRLEKLSKKFGANPNHFMMLFYAESKVNPKAKNPKSTATGLIQFMEDTAIWLGTSTKYLITLNATQQLDWVDKYYTKIVGIKKLHTYFDVYLVTFFPGAIGKPDTYIFETKKTSASAIAKVNPAININKDSKITVGEFKQYLIKSVPTKYYSLIFGNDINIENSATTINNTTKNDTPSFVGLLVVVLGLALLYFTSK